MENFESRRKQQFIKDIHCLQKDQDIFTTIHSSNAILTNPKNLEILELALRHSQKEKYLEDLTIKAVLEQDIDIGFESSR